MNGIQGTKSSVKKLNWLLDAVVKIVEHKKNTIDNIWIKVFSDGTVTYLKVSTDDFLNTTNKDTYFTEIRKVFEESFDIKIQELSMLKYPNFRIYQSPLGTIHSPASWCDQSDK